MSFLYTWPFLVGSSASLYVQRKGFTQKTFSRAFLTGLVLSMCINGRSYIFKAPLGTEWGGLIDLILLITLLKSAGLWQLDRLPVVRFRPIERDSFKAAVSNESDANVFVVGDKVLDLKTFLWTPMEVLADHTFPLSVTSQQDTESDAESDDENEDENENDSGDSIDGVLGSVDSVDSSTNEYFMADIPQPGKTPPPAEEEEAIEEKKEVTKTSWFPKFLRFA